MKTDIAAVFRIRIRIRVFFTDPDPDKSGSGSVHFINLGDLNDCFDKVLEEPDQKRQSEDS